MKHKFYKDLETGAFVTAKYAKEHPDETFMQERICDSTIDAALVPVHTLLYEMSEELDELNDVEEHLATAHKLIKDMANHINNKKPNRAGLKLIGRANKVIISDVRQLPKKGDKR